MSYLSEVHNCAPDIQDLLSAHFTGIGNGISPDQFPMLQYLNMQAKTMGIKQIVNPRPGKVRDLQLLYTRPILESDVSDTGLSNCATGDTIGDSYVDYQIDTTNDAVKFNSTVTLSDLHCTSEPFETFFTKKLLVLIDGVDRKVSSKTATQLALLTGAWSDNAESAYTVSSNALQIDYKSGSGSAGSYNVEKFYDIADALTMTGFGNEKVIFGGSQINGLVKFAQAGCCASNGVDLGQIFAEYGIASVYDRHVASALGGEAYSVAVQSGALALLTFNEAGWKDGVPMLVNASSFKKFSVVSPKTGVPMDVTVSEDCTTGGITISVSACTKLVGLPTDLFQTGDNYLGVKFVNKIQAV